MQKKTRPELVYGLRAVLALIAKRPADLLELFCLETEAAALQQSPKQPSIVSSHKLTQLAQTHQHEGIVARVKPRPPLSLLAWADHLLQAPSHAIALDRVRNPYNIGSVYRSASFFGIQGLLLGSLAHEDWPQIKRVAEGGFEHVHTCMSTDLLASVQRLKNEGFVIYGAEDDAKTNLEDIVPTKPSLFILGNEESGMKASLRKECNHMVRLRGNGAVKSLNVAHTATLIAHHLFQVTR